MAFRRPSAPGKTPAVVETVTASTDAANGALVAAASPVKLDTKSLRNLKVGDQEWQREAWRHYDICGELRFLSNRHANACGRVRVYIADVDDDGVPGAETSDPEMKALSQTIFGGFAARAKGVAKLALQNYVAGEAYLVAESARTKDDDDKWYVVSSSEIKKKDSKLRVTRPDDKGGGELVLEDGKDMLIRIWTQHPRQNNVPDSSVRAALPILREIERLTLLTFSQIDSRLISAGLLLLPKGVDFPHDASKPGGVQGLMDMLLDAAKAQMQGAGTAAGLVPIMAEIDAEQANAVHHITFDSKITSELKDKLEHAIGRLARALDCEPEDLLGHGQTNHWSGWLIDEITIKLYIEPVVATICDALTTACLVPYAKRMGKDPSKFTFWLDSAGLTVRPNRFNDAKDLHAVGAISADSLRNEANFSEDDAPEDDEMQVWRLWELVKLNPAMAENPTVAKLLGLPDLTPPPPPPPPVPVGPDGKPLPPPPPNAPGGAIEQGGQGGGNQGSETRGVPATESKQAKGGQPALTASSDPYASMLPGAEQAVLRALELAGGRLLDRHSRGKYGEVAKFELHTRVKASDASHAHALLAGAWTHLPTLAHHHGVPPAELEYLLEGYATELLTRGHPHESKLLASVLERAAAYRG